GERRRLTPSPRTRPCARRQRHADHREQQPGGERPPIALDVARDAAALAAFASAHPKGGDAEVEYDRGTALFKLGRYQEAKQAFVHSAALAPRAHALYDLGNSDAALKDETGAIAAYRGALAVDPKDEAARHNLEVLLQKKQSEQQPTGNQQKKKDQRGKGDQQKQKQQQQAGNQQKKDQDGKGDQQKQKQQQQAGNQQKKDQDGKGDQQKQKQQQAGNEPKKEQDDAQQQQQQAAPAQPATHAPDRAAQARADAQLTPHAARILDSMRTIDRTLPLSRFAPPTPRSAHEKDW
ncbi:MAG: tetratricopeptide repeat protein, partial [Myxococcales bacterium]|nr:tetratricopeptide repeat protein [Myxococcales bacterium]